MPVRPSPGVGALASSSHDPNWRNVVAAAGEPSVAVSPPDVAAADVCCDVVGVGVVVVGVVVVGVVVVGVVGVVGAGAGGAFFTFLTACPTLSPSTVMAFCRSAKLRPWFFDAFSVAMNWPWFLKPVVACSSVIP